MQGSKKSQMIPIFVFGIYLGRTNCQINRITHNAQVAYLKLRLAEQDYKNKILTVRI